MRRLPFMIASMWCKRTLRTSSFIEEEVTCFQAGKLYHFYYDPVRLEFKTYNELNLTHIFDGDGPFVQTIFNLDEMAQAEKSAVSDTDYAKLEKLYLKSRRRPITD